MKRILSLLFALLLTMTGLSSVAYADEAATTEPQVTWISGPTAVKPGGMADLQLSDRYRYLNQEDTVTMMEYFGNPSSEAEMGSVFPVDENQNWFVIFEYFDTGHVDDKDKDKINADELLQSMKDGTEEANKTRKERGMAELHVTGWSEKPRYIDALHCLAWGTVCESEGEQIINYECRLLCREGYVSATLVCPPEDLEACKPYMTEIVNNFKFIKGKQYSDYVPGKDKLSELGLAALILGGTAAVAKKGGLLILILAAFKKAWILLFAAIWGFFKKRKTKKELEQEIPFQAEQPVETNPDSNSSHPLTEETDPSSVDERRVE